jgi:hypothetical protein
VIVDAIRIVAAVLQLMIGRRNRNSSRRKEALISMRPYSFRSAWDRKQRDREIARLIARSGGRFTDEFERRMSD